MPRGMRMAMPIGGWEGGTGMSTRKPIGKGKDAQQDACRDA